MHTDPNHYPPPAPPPHYQVPPAYNTAQPLPAPMMATPLAADATQTRNAAIALIGAGVLLLIGMVSHSWFSTRGGNVGLLGLEECRKFGCTSINWLDVQRAPTEIKLFASIGLLGGLAAIGFLIQAAVVLFKNQPHRVQFKWLNGALGAAAFGCFGFFFQLAFGEMSKRLSMSWAGIAAMAAIIAASVIAAKLVRPLMRTPSR